MASRKSPSSRIRSFLWSVRDIDASRDFVRTKALGEDLDFSNLESLFVEFQELAAVLAEVAWDILPQSVQVSVLSSIENLQSAYIATTQFGAAEGEDRQAQLAVEFEQRLEEFKEKSLPYAGFLLWRQSGVERRADVLLQSIEESLASTKAAQEDVERKREAVDDVLDTARGAIAELSASKEAAAFHEAANRYDSLAKRWLKGSIASALTAIGVGLLLLFVWSPDDSLMGVAAWQSLLGRAAVIAVLSYATVTAVRMYRSNAHLAVVNRHREDALKTFRTFVEGTDAEETKRQILLAAAHAAFGQTATGLVGEKADGTNTLEVVEGLMGRSFRGP